MEDKIQTQSQKTIQMFDFGKLKGVWLNVRADVGASTYWSKIAIVQTLDNLRASGILDVIDYLERMPEEYIPLKDALISKYKQIQMQGSASAAPTQEGPSPGASAGLNQSSLLSTLPGDTQQKFDTMSTKAQNVILQKAGLQHEGGI